MKKILLLGSGELGKEFVISAQRKGQYIIACDSYAGAPAMQVADECEVFSMLDGDALERVVRKHQPDIIVPEIEAIRTERLYDFEKEGIQVVPSARAVNFTMNRKAIRDLAAKELGLKTAKYFYAKSLDELKAAAEKIGFPCVVKPLMSSSGKGQSLVKSADELEHAWEYGCNGSRGDIKELIIEEFIKFDSEITLLTVTQKNGPTLFCPPIGHVQKGGDYRESFQPAHIDPALKEKLNRPMRVCGMVKNVGEPGGGPFLAYNSDGIISLQILESSQIDMDDPEKKEMFEKGTHFNPVDLVCAVRDYKGHKFNLVKYVDKATGFISYKSKNGKDLKALELPGLWNGAMSDWNTVFVEVPLTTFNPVKTVNDLLREQHQ